MDLLILALLAIAVTILAFIYNNSEEVIDNDSELQREIRGLHDTFTRETLITARQKREAEALNVAIQKIVFSNLESTVKVEKLIELFSRQRKQPLKIKKHHL